jgi:hypothetical protein
MTAKVSRIIQGDQAMTADFADDVDAFKRESRVLPLSALSAQFAVKVVGLMCWRRCRARQSVVKRLLEEAPSCTFRASRIVPRHFNFEPRSPFP